MVNPPVGKNNPERVSELFLKFLDEVAQLEGLEEAAGYNDSEGLFGVLLLVNAPGPISCVSNLEPEDQVGICAEHVRALIEHRIETTVSQPDSTKFH